MSTADDDVKEMAAKLRANQHMNLHADPALISDVIKLGIFHFEAGAREFLKWSDLMISDIGARVRPHLREVWMRMPVVAREEAQKKIKAWTPLAEAQKIRERADIFSGFEKKPLGLIDASGKEVGLGGGKAIDATREEPHIPTESKGFGRTETAPSKEPCRQSAMTKAEPKPDDTFLAGTNLHGLAKVAGMRELKALLEKDVVQAFRNPDVFRRYGLSIPHGILLFGPPGCGKTYIARQLAEELGCTFIESRQSDVASIYIHGSAIQIRNLFDTAEKAAPSVLFIDEFEGMVPSRAGLGTHQQYKSEEVNEFLSQLNECGQKKILVVAATNEPKKIDTAILRTGRMDKLIYVYPPDADARFEMLRFHLLNRPTESRLDLRGIAAILDGYSASDIRFLVDEAARKALDQRTIISTDTIMEALRRVPPSITEEDQERFRSFGSRGS